MSSGVEEEGGDIAEVGDAEEGTGDAADGGTEVGGTGVVGATDEDGPIDHIAGSMADMGTASAMGGTDVLTGIVGPIGGVACPTTAGMGGRLSDLDLASALGGESEKSHPSSEGGLHPLFVGPNPWPFLSGDVRRARR
jgi:hypothetical protein